MKQIKKAIVIISLVLVLGLIAPRSVSAVSLNEVVDTGSGFIVRVQETFEYVFAFGVEKKVKVLDKQAERRLEKARMYAENGDEERVENMIRNYSEIKERQNVLMGKIDDGQMINQVAEKVVEQQQRMEEIKNWVVDPGTKEQMIQVQEEVVNQVAKNIVEVNGEQGRTEFFEKVEHVWAPGTGPGGGEAGVVYEGGGKLIFAPGTGPGRNGEAKQDIQKVIIETDGGRGQE